MVKPSKRNPIKKNLQRGRAIRSRIERNLHQVPYEVVKGVNGVGKLFFFLINNGVGKLFTIKCF